MDKISDHIDSYSPHSSKYMAALTSREKEAIVAICTFLRTALESIQDSNKDVHRLDAAINKHLGDIADFTGVKVMLMLSQLLMCGKVPRNNLLVVHNAPIFSKLLEKARKRVKVLSLPTPETLPELWPPSD
jgi:hypothetical protein